MKMEQTECSETLAYKFQAKGKYPEESTQVNNTKNILEIILFPANP